MTPTSVRSQREVFGHTLVELVQEDPRVLVLDGDLATSTRADIVADAAPDAFLQMGIAEQNMVGVAAGLASVGYLPFLSTFACFAVCRALDQTRVLVAQTGLPVVLVGSYSGLLTGMTGKTHQVVEDLAIMRSVPGMTVLAPADDIEAAVALRYAKDLGAPSYVRLARDPSPRLFDGGRAATFPRPALLRDGDDLGIVSTGIHTARAVAAADALKADGIHAAVLHVPAIKPCDPDPIIELARQTGCLMTTEEHTVLGGLGGAVAEIVGNAHPVPLMRHGIADTYGESAPNDALLERYGLTAYHISQRARAFLGQSA